MATIAKFVIVFLSLSRVYLSFAGCELGYPSGQECNGAPGRCTLNWDGTRGGFVADTAHIEQKRDFLNRKKNIIFISSDSQICDNAQIKGKVQVGNSIISGHSSISGTVIIIGARISDRSIIEGQIRITRGTKIYENAKIIGSKISLGPNVNIYGEAKIGNGNLQNNKDTKAFEMYYPNRGIDIKNGAQIFGHALICGSVLIDGPVIVKDRSAIYDRAKLIEKVQVYGRSAIFGNAQISGSAQIYGMGRVFEDAKVSGDAQICGKASVGGNVEVAGDVILYGIDKVSGFLQLFNQKQVMHESETFCSDTPEIQENENHLERKISKFLNMEQIEKAISLSHASDHPLSLNTMLEMAIYYKNIAFFDALILKNKKADWKFIFQKSFYWDPEFSIHLLDRFKKFIGSKDERKYLGGETIFTLLSSQMVDIPSLVWHSFSQNGFSLTKKNSDNMTPEKIVWKRGNLNNIIELIKHGGTFHRSSIRSIIKEYPSNTQLFDLFAFLECIYNKENFDLFIKTRLDVWLSKFNENISKLIEKSIPQICKKMSDIKNKRHPKQVHIEEEKKCKYCDDEIELDYAKTIKKGCFISICPSCEEAFIKNCLNNSGVERILCPGCNKQLSDKCMRDLLLSRKSKNSIIQNQYNLMNSQMGGWRSCPNGFCPGGIIIKEKGNNQFDCSVCGWKGCLLCNQKHSEKLDCDMFKEICIEETKTKEFLDMCVEKGKLAPLIPMPTDKNDPHYYDGRFRPCKYCGLLIEKNEGCGHMKCKCGKDFHWENGEYTGDNSNGNGPQNYEPNVEPHF